MNDLSPIAAQERPPRTLRIPAELAAVSLVPAEKLAALENVAARYAVAVTRAIAGLIDPHDPADPIGRHGPDFCGVDRRLSPSIHPCRLRLGDAFALAFEHHLPLELSKSNEHVEDQPPSSAGIHGRR